MNRPFAREEVKLVPDEFVTGTVLSRLHSEFKRTNTWPYGFDDLLGDWKGGRIRLAGVFETEAVFDHARENHDWHMKTFAKPGAPWSIFSVSPRSRLTVIPKLGGSRRRWIGSVHAGLGACSIQVVWRRGVARRWMPDCRITLNVCTYPKNHHASTRMAAEMAANSKAVYMRSLDALTSVTPSRNRAS